MIEESCTTEWVIMCTSYHFVLGRYSRCDPAYFMRLRRKTNESGHPVPIIEEKNLEAKKQIGQATRICVKLLNDLHLGDLDIG